MTISDVALPHPLQNTVPTANSFLAVCHGYICVVVILVSFFLFSFVCFYLFHNVSFLRVQQLQGKENEQL